MRLLKLLWRKYTLRLSPNTMKAILIKRHGIRKKEEISRPPL